MIEQYGEHEFVLICDHCSANVCDKTFDTFQDAVDYKTDRSNGWASVTDRGGEWFELCPSCNKPEVIAKLKGLRRDDRHGNTPTARESAMLADIINRGIEEEEE